MRQVDSPEALIRFQNEAVALAKLNHHNIAKVLDFAYDDGVTYMVMEYLDGESYASKLKARELSLIDNISIFIEIAEGLVHAHKKGVLHRDLKPSNVMIVRDTTRERQSSVAKIVDFGIAKLHGDDLRLTTTNALVGSPLYMSPEQAQGRPVDSRSEIYSFGCLMFEALKGHVPLKGKSYLETINMHIDTPAPHLNSSSKNPEFPEEIDNLIFRCLKKNPDERVQSAAQLVTELSDILEDVTNEELARQEALERETEENGIKDDGITVQQLSALSNKLLIGGIAGFLVLTIAISFYLYLNSTKETHKVKTNITNAEFSKEAMSENVQDNVETLMCGGINYDPQEHTLHISGVGSEAEMQNIKELRKPIRDLRLTSCEVQGEFLKIVNTDELLNLALNNTKIDDNGMRLISRFPHLASLQSTKNENLTTNGYSGLYKFKNFVFLQIDPADRLTDESIKRISHFKDLRVLALGKATHLTDNCIPAITGFHKIQTLSLKNCSFTSDGLARIISGRKLLQLDLEELPFNNQMCKAIVPQKSIRELALKRIDGLSSQNFKDICHNMNTLTRLEIDCKKVDREALWSLEHLTNLTSLSLFDPKWSDKLTDTICRLPLENLKIDESDMPLDQVKKLTVMKSLRRLELIHFDERFRKPMENLENLTNGRITGTYTEKRPGEDAAEFLGHR